MTLDAVKEQTIVDLTADRLMLARCLVSLMSTLEDQLPPGFEDTKVAALAQDIVADWKLSGGR